MDIIEQLDWQIKALKRTIETPVFPEERLMAPHLHEQLRHTIALKADLIEREFAPFPRPHDDKDEDDNCENVDKENFSIATDESILIVDFIGRTSRTIRGPAYVKVRKI